MYGHHVVSKNQNITAIYIIYIISELNETYINRIIALELMRIPEPCKVGFVLRRCKSHGNYI